MNDTHLPPSSDDDLRLAEYALGVLSPEQRREVDALIAKRPQHQATLAAWQAYFARWLDQLPECEPPAGTWQAIERQLPAAPGATIARPEQRRRAKAWRWPATAALALSLLLAAVVNERLQPLPAPTLLARLAQSDGTTLFTATVQGDGRSVVFIATGDATWPGHSAQAWVIPADGTPRSLGLLPATAGTALEVPSALAPSLGSGALLAVSIEPPAGSPTGLPTGPVVAKGTISPL